MLSAGSKQVHKAVPSAEAREVGADLGPVRTTMGIALRFIVALLLLSALLMLDDRNQGVATRELLPSAAAKAAAVTLSALGLSTRSTDVWLTYEGTTLEIDRSCLGLEIHMLFVAAVVAFPVAWRRRLAGVAIGVAVLLVLNQVRIMTLVVLAPYDERVLELGHVWVWPILLMVIAVGMLLTWARSLDARHLRA